MIQVQVERAHSLSKHTQTHNRDSSGPRRLESKLHMPAKTMLSGGTGMAVVQDLLPFDFVSGKGMISFATACFQAGQASSVAQTIDMTDALPCAAIATKSVKV